MKPRLTRLLSILLLGIAAHSTTCMAQTQTPVSDTLRPATATVTTVDTVTEMQTDTVKHPFQPNPKRAGLYSALLPGLGQVYNRQYWKVPIVYAGLGVATYFLVDNITWYQKYRQAYIGRINNNFPTDEFPEYSRDQLRQLQEDASSAMNTTVLYTSLGFILQIIDAITSAHLKNFDISRDISLSPMVTPRGMGMGLAVHF